MTTGLYIYVIDLLGFNRLKGSKELVPPPARKPPFAAGVWSRDGVILSMFQVWGLENVRPVPLYRAAGSYREKRNLNYGIHTQCRSNDGPRGLWTFAGVARAP